MRRSTGTVDIFRARFADLPDLPDLLSDTERERAGRFLRASDAVRFRAGRAWMRQRIADELGVAPVEISLVAGPQGKPELPGSPLHFNLTHAQDHIWLAIADRPVGLDLELPPGYDLLPLFRQIATAEEYGQAMAEGLTSERFLTVWTAKEAVLKLLGTGLTTDPRTISLGHPGDDLSSPRKIDGRWVCWRRLPAPPDAVAHVAMFGQAAEVALHGQDRTDGF